MNNYIYGEPPMLDMSDIPVSEVMGFNHSAFPKGVIIVDEPLSESTTKRFTSMFNVTMNNDTILKTLTDTLGPHVIKVLKRTDRAAEYLANWKIQCRIESDRCVVLRDSVVIGVGYYD